MREHEQALCSTTAERTRWGASTRRSAREVHERAQAGSPQYNHRENKVGEVSTKELYGGERTAGLLSAVNNSSGPAALTELKVKIQVEPESDFFSPTLSKFIWSRVLLLTPHHLTSVVCSRVLLSPRITHHSPPSPS